MKELKLAIDATPLLLPKTGIGNYTSKLIQTLGSSNYPVELNLFYGWKWSREVKHAPDPNFDAAVKIFKRGVPKAYRVGAFLKQQVFNYGVKKWRPDVLHGPNYIAPNFDGPTVITVHDLSYLRYPETLPADRLAWLDRYLPKSIEGAVKIITVSEFVKREIMSCLSVPGEKIVVTYNGVDSVYRPLSYQELHQQLGHFDLKPHQYILSVGTIEPRKNLGTLITAYSRLQAKIRERYPLVLVGMMGWKESSLMNTIEPLRQSGQIRVLGYVPHESLPALYGGARVFAYPSFYEGFGMPVSEAMACGTPVIASDCASIPEVVGKAGILLNPNDIDEWSVALSEIIDNNEKYELLKVQGLERASFFSWEKAAEKTYQVYRQIK